MKRKKVLRIWWITICCCTLLPAAAEANDFIRRSGAGLVVGAAATPVTLRGVNISLDRLDPGGGGDWFSGSCQELANNPSATPVTNWYQEKHLQLLAEIGFNMVRMNLHYRIFEDDSAPGTYKQSGWTVLDTYVQWAETHDLYLIVDLHVPPGGLQPSGGGGACLWDDAANQTRLINLWTAIAQRYADEPRIAAYDLLNEPTPSSSASQWTTLAQQIVDAVRAVDQNHLIIVERVNWIVSAAGTSSLSDWDLAVLAALQVSVTDDNVLYDYHFYDPFAYCLQNEGSYPDEGNYPDESTAQTAKDGSAHVRNQSYLDYELGLENRSGEPMFVGEWGPNLSTYNDTKGGYRYVQDVLELFDSHSLHWAFYSMFNLYTVDCCATGVTCCSGDNPTSAHTERVQMFEDYFSALTTVATTSTTASTSSSTTTTGSGASTTSTTASASSSTTTTGSGASTTTAGDNATTTTTAAGSSSTTTTGGITTSLASTSTSSIAYDSTTSTISADTSSTTSTHDGDNDTTTTPGRPRCPALQALGNQNPAAVDLLRRFRDNTLATTGAGRELIEEYYGCGPELAALLAGDADLRRRTSVAITLLLPAVRHQVLEGGPLVLHPSERRMVEQLLQKLAARGGPDLGRRLSAVLQQMTSNPAEADLLRLLGLASESIAPLPGHAGILSGSCSSSPQFPPRDTSR